MERGLLWLPLLGVFFWLAWNGWNEYQKVESYRLWAEQFDNAKYDIYSVIGYKDKQITWGKPTRQGPVNVQTFSLTDIQAIRLLVNDQPVEGGTLPSKGSATLEFVSGNGDTSIIIPFTEIPLAAKWAQFLQQFT
ncbi:hypothetical protein [Gloeothece verrucosa]|uniref:Uncharacterized protein n=1 Tax=Gloeothece verrucosa (strain PCC 7822) TaxID=497965 RepID=E0UBP7_GLOV7|nr:hypothetical protein [Gloeothece verrucosa]ADN13991.1 conserved hypothetical protein [Gloeothece verrucosa PCC 7822]